MNIYKEIQWFEIRNKGRKSLIVGGTKNGGIPINRFSWGRLLFDYVGIRSADVHVISYPKAGRTWLRMMLTEYLLHLYGLDLDVEHTSLFQIHCRDPRIPLVRFSHDHITFTGSRKVNRSLYRSQKIVLLMREVKDLLVSAYHQAADRMQVFEGTIQEFISHPDFGVHKVVAFYNSWYRDRAIPRNFLTMHYEELLRDPYGQLAKFLRFIDLPIDNTALEHAVERCSFTNMYRMQFQSSLSYLKVADVNNPNSFKVRKAKVGKYKDELSEEDIRFIDKYVRENASEQFLYYLKGAERQ